MGKQTNNNKGRVHMKKEKMKKKKKKKVHGGINIYTHALHKMKHILANSNRMTNVTCGIDFNRE